MDFYPSSLSNPILPMLPYSSQPNMLPNTSMSLQDQYLSHFNPHNGLGSLYYSSPFLNSGAVYPPLPPPELTYLQPPEPEFTPADEKELARVICTNRKTKNLAEIFLSLNGRNNHSTEQWKDFYMRNSNRIEAIKFGNAIDLPGQFHAEASDTLPIKHEKAAKNKRSGYRTRGRSGVGYALRNNDSRPSSRGKNRIFLGIPLPRLRPIDGKRSPTPPARVVRLKRGYQYTEEDRVFFRKMLEFELRRNPRIMYHPWRLAEMLARKAPHHTRLSWSCWMRDNSLDIDNFTNEILQRNASQSECIDEDNATVSSSAESESDGEMHALAKYIANITITTWNRRRGHGRWREFQEMYANQRRSLEGWRKWYSKNKEKIIGLVEKIEVQNMSRKKADNRQSQRKSFRRGHQDSRPRAAQPAPYLFDQEIDKQTRRRAEPSCPLASPSPPGPIKTSPGPDPVLEFLGSH